MHNKRSPKPLKRSLRIGIAMSREQPPTLMQAHNQLQLALVWMRDDNRTHLSRDMAEMALNMYFVTVEKLVVSLPLPIATIPPAGS